MIYGSRITAIKITIDSRRIDALAGNEGSQILKKDDQIPIVYELVKLVIEKLELGTV